MEERDELSNIRRRKKELLDDIEVSIERRMMCFIVCISGDVQYDLIVK